MCDAAAERGLELDVTFFTGHMSGPNWSPGWLLAPDGPSPTPNPRQVVSGGRVVDGSYRNPFHDPEAIAAERLLLATVVGEYRDHPAIWMWNLGNEPDLFAWPASAAAGRAWVRDLRAFVRDIDPDHPVTCGLHVDEPRGRQPPARRRRVRRDRRGGDARLPDVRELGAAIRSTTDFVPFVCALTSAMCAKPVLAEEWGGCTVPGGGPSQTWEWIDHTGAARTQFMAGEDALAEHVAAVLPKLVDVGATGALLWCFADYAEHLWDRPPCDPHGAIHERHFGLVRPDGTLKPHAEAVRRFAATRSDRASRPGGQSSSASAPTSTTPIHSARRGGSTTSSWIRPPEHARDRRRPGSPARLGSRCPPVVDRRTLLAIGALVLVAGACSDGDGVDSLERRCRTGPIRAMERVGLAADRWR